MKGPVFSRISSENDNVIADNFKYTAEVFKLKLLNQHFKQPNFNKQIADFVYIDSLITLEIIFII